MWRATSSTRTRTPPTAYSKRGGPSRSKTSHPRRRSFGGRGYCQKQTPALTLLVLIHERLVNRNSPKFAHENIATWHTKIRHMGDAPHPARLVPYLWDVTQGGGPKLFALRPDSKRKGESTWQQQRNVGE